MSDRGLRVLVSAVSRHWRRVLFVGLLDIVIGLVALIWPDATVLVLAILLGILLVISGASSLSVGLAMRSPVMAILGVLSLVAAVICLAHPGAGVFAILLGCALWFLLNGIAELGAAMSGADYRLWWGALGVLSIVAGVIMISSPGVAIVTVSIIAGVAFLIRGFGQVALAWRLRTVHHAITDR